MCRNQVTVSCDSWWDIRRTYTQPPGGNIPSTTTHTHGSMSAAMTVSAFYDVDCFSSQNRRNLAQQQTHSHPAHKPIGTPITNIRHMTAPNRNLLERSVSEPADKNSNSALMAQQQQQNRQQQNVNSSRYKTELCRPFEENGYCKYGDKCQFAHGMPELRSLARHPKYKTELCRTFHTIGFCPYGPRCHFIHNEDERKLGEIDHMKEERGQGNNVSNMPPSPPISQPNPPHYGRLSPPQHSANHSRRTYGLSLPLVRDSLGSTADSPTSSVTDSPIMSPTFVGDSDMLSSSFSSAASAPFSHPPPMSAPVRSSSSNAFSFHDLPPMQQAATLMSPLNIHTDTMANLAAEMQAMLSLSQRHNNNHNLNVLASLQQHQQQKQSTMGVFGLTGLTSGLVGLPEDNLYGAPPSPPDSLSGDSNSSCSSSSMSSMSTSSMCGSPLEVSRGLRLPIFTTLSHE